MQDDGEFSGHSNDGPSVTAGLGDLHPPGFQGGPFCRSREQGVGGGVQCRSHIGITGSRDVAVEIDLTGLRAPGGESEVGTDGS